MSRKFVRSVVVGTALLAATVLGACRDSGKEQLFAISGKLFEFNYRLGIATYVITLNPLRPMGEGQVAVVSFQNPAGGDPIIVNQKIWPKLPHVTLTSPPLTCVVKDKPYSVSIRIEDANGKLLQSFETTLTSSMDQSVLPDRPLVIGPVYELNKDMVGHPDGKLPDEPKPDCPKPA
ncbi:MULTISPECIES: hypothetical protein [unclassified Mesorhizobium]|uniref:hypothetical protein n=1 Tax=unclassified Mesorhizobium TaxID=325217 RepID=UPI000BB013B3|nr:MULTISPECIES: hypothetical protein [unclassified Mesorhizobium]TGT60773.1 hypothetical protein EN813_024170 [Mesorhizobium sp. M00.F.Ca.ET.170.01.1.1]AZO10127.1 hypothetical protein EJ074_14160 [Mesorhizobium sp. M3A.F.Ca.ET.080.04.2.1]PBB86584.1 hypothetical protein CK216_13175 [Mesorhizobium sp. WSM3876]RWB75814.1 MAG: hypothetical protein EOQ49_04855 [Mesorhizobium sp.]RWB91565.1 MAG: hypothetical protein EOQ52_04215 [Mesorhizobium sp.]